MNDWNVHSEEERALAGQLTKLEELTGHNKALILDFFERYLVKNRLSASRKARVLITLRKMANKGYSLDNLSERDLEAVNIELAKQNASLHTVKTMRDILKVFLRFIGNQTLASCKELKSPNPYKNPEYRLKFSDLLTQPEVASLINFSKPKMAALIALLYGSGCRVGAAKSLTRKDCLWSSGNALTVNIVSKGSVNSLWIRPDLAVVVRKWFNVSPFKGEDDLVFHNPKGSILSSQSILKELKKAGQKAGIHKRIYPHLFRHTHLSELLNAGVPSSFIKSRGWNNQSSIQLDLVYGHLDKKAETEAIMKAFGYAPQTEEPKQEPLKQKVCFACGKAWDFTVSVCTCGINLDEKPVPSLTDGLEGRLMALEEHQRMILVALKEITGH